MTDDGTSQPPDERVETGGAPHSAPRHDGVPNGTPTAPSGESLSYESSIPGALQPGERVLFECRPDATLRRQPLVARVALVVVISFMVAVAAGAVTSNAIAAVVAGVLAVILVGAAVLLAGDRAAQRELGHATFRVSDRRVIRMDDRPGRPALEVHATSFDQLRVARGGRRPGATLTGGAATFTHVPDAARFERAVIDLVARSGRRRQVRRMPSLAQAASRMNAAVHEPQQPELTLPDGLVLAAGEKVIWSGRPRVAENLDLAWLLGRLQIIAWTLVPLGFVLAALGAFEPWIKRINFVWGFLAAFLLLAALYSLLVAPFVQAYRRSRTSYALTNVRAVVHTRSLRRGSVTDSYLLDMAGMTQLKERSDGTGDVWMSAGAMFERIERPGEVHLLVLDAIRHAGTPLTPPRDDDEDF